MEENGMPERKVIKVENRLVEEKRDLNIYHHATRSAYLISHSNAVAVSLGEFGEGDYLHISVVSGPGNLVKDTWIDLPSWCDFSVTGLVNGEILHRGDRTFVRVPPGPPDWKVEVKGNLANEGKDITDYITIGDEKT